jgi:hypothetical protein
MDPEIIKRNFIYFGILITIIVAGSLIWNIQKERNMVNELASVEAQASHERDLLFRRWASMHGGVYVPVTEQTQPNPLLSDIPERDIVTGSGKKLTLMNPAYMNRQIYTMAGDEGLLGHITSLNPIRKENKADSWETNALQQCDRGDYEIKSAETVNGQDYLRVMYALKTENNCLNCHGKQGYKLGDIRGGISISVPLDKYRMQSQASIVSLIKIHLIAYFLILILIFIRYEITLNQIE